MANVQQRYRCACVRACVTTQNQVYVFTSFNGDVGSLDITAYPSGLVVPISPSITDGYAGVLQYVAHVSSRVLFRFGGTHVMHGGTPVYLRTPRFAVEPVWQQYKLLLLGTTSFFVPVSVNRPFTQVQIVSQSGSNDQALVLGQTDGGNDLQRIDLQINSPLSPTVWTVSFTGTTFTYLPQAQVVMVIGSSCCGTSSVSAILTAWRSERRLADDETAVVVVS